MKYIKPEAFGPSFTCPYCGVLAQQRWWVRNWVNRENPMPGANPLRIGTCQHCLKNTVWVEAQMCYPDATVAPPANAHMPPDVLKVYHEASSIAEKSPRGAAALLRLSIELLCNELAPGSKDINEAIKKMVSHGLPQRIQQSLDVVRVIGNEAVHPGTIDTDDPETVQSLFGLVNLIVEHMIEGPQRVSALYESLPPEKRKKIEERDKPKT